MCSKGQLRKADQRFQSPPGGSVSRRSREEALSEKDQRGRNKVREVRLDT